MQAGSNSIEIKSRKSIKWSLFAELFAKVSIPLSTMVLARLLTPEIFGITTAVSIVVSFCEAITETGFSKFLIQHDFKDENEYKKYISVSCIFSFAASVILCLVVFIFRFQLSSFVGNSGYEMILVVSCIQMPFTAINSVFVSHLRRVFGFKNLFYIRIIYCICPFIITIPLAFLGMGPWALVIGTIAGQIFQTPFLLFLCKKQLRPYFSFSVLGKTIKYSFPMVLESVIIWMSTWIMTFVATQFFDSYTVGIVKVANSTVTSIFGIFTTSFTNVLFSALSRLKNDEKGYQNSFYSIQSSAFTIVIPLSIGCFFYSDLITSILLGSQWTAASFVIGVLGVTMCLRICFNNFISEVFRSKGHFYSSIIYHVLALLVNLSLEFTIGRYSFDMFVWTNVFSYIVMMVIAIIVLKIRYHFSFLKQISSLIPALVSCLFMIPILLLKNVSSYGLFQSIGQVMACVAAYFTGGLLLYRQLFKQSLSHIGFERFVGKI